jgi:hypothetical protein
VSAAAIRPELTAGDGLAASIRAANPENPRAERQRPSTRLGRRLSAQVAPSCPSAPRPTFRSASQRAFEEWKHAMWDPGCKLPTQAADGRSECFCGAPIDIADVYRHVYAARIYPKGSRDVTEEIASEFSPALRRSRRNSLQPTGLPQVPRRLIDMAIRRSLFTQPQVLAMASANASCVGRSPGGAGRRGKAGQCRLCIGRAITTCSYIAVEASYRSGSGYARRYGK